MRTRTWIVNPKTNCWETPAPRTREWWMKHRGAIPKELYVCHKCDNPRCINLDHLFLGTQYDNVHDAMDKGRLNNKGSRNGMSKLTKDEVQIIKSTPKWIGSGRMLSKRFNISETQISVIRNGVKWK